MLPKDAKIVQPDYSNFAVVQNQLNDWWVKNIAQ
jgi:hypothetical protein